MAQPDGDQDMAPLNGITVLDLGRFIAGPACGALLADLGAEVIRIDKPNGSEDRELMSRTPEQDGKAYLVNNRGKKSIELDLQDPSDRAFFDVMLAQSDVVIANLPLTALNRLGVGYEALCKVKPDIVLGCISAFGSEGPLADRTGFDGVAQAVSGAIHLSGTPDRPMRSQVTYVDYATAQALAYGVASALFRRDRTGVGGIVEASLLASALSMVNATLLEDIENGEDRARTGNRSTVAGPSDVFETSDGLIVVQVVGTPIFRRWTRLVGRPDLETDPRFLTDFGRGRAGRELSLITAEWVRTLTTEEALRRLDEARVPCGPVLSPLQMWQSPDIQQGGYFTEVTHTGHGSYPLVGAPLRLSGYDVRPATPAPASNAHGKTLRARFHASHSQGSLS